MKHVLAWAIMSGAIFCALLVALLLFDFVSCLIECRHMTPDPGTGAMYVLLGFSSVAGYSSMSGSINPGSNDVARFALLLPAA